MRDAKDLKTEHKHLRARIRRYIASRDTPPSKCELCRAFGVNWEFISSLLGENPGHEGDERTFRGSFYAHTPTQSLVQDDGEKDEAEVFGMREQKRVREIAHAGVRLPRVRGHEPNRG
jgi:hypothetical protein